MSEKPLIDVPTTNLANLRAAGSRQIRAVQMGPCRIVVSRDPSGYGGALLWHLSISCADRYPTWDEIKDARYRLLPNHLTFVMFLPPPSEYVNVHENCFHLHEYDGSARP